MEQTSNTSMRIPTALRDAAALALRELLRVVSTAGYGQWHADASVSRRWTSRESLGAEQAERARRGELDAEHGPSAGAYYLHDPGRTELGVQLVQESPQ
jgi:hypothetical protein